MHFTADTEFRDLLERVRALASHRLATGDLKTVLQRGLEAYERELVKERFAVGAKPRASRVARVTTESSSEVRPHASRKPRSEVRSHANQVADSIDRATKDAAVLDPGEPLAGQFQAT